MKKSAIYVRVSTHHQIDKDSLPLQKQDLINYSKYILGIEDYEIFEDAGYSGKNTDRPAFQDMMDRVRKNEFSHILVWKIDRISRNLLNFCDMYDELKKCGIIFISKNEQFDTSSAMGEAMLKIILVFAELERKLTGERVTSVMLSRAEKGLWNGAPMPLGYKWNEETKFPEIHLGESEIINYIYSQYEHLESTSAVMRLLNGERIKTKRNGSWTTKTISDIIRNPFYKGTYRYNFRESARGKKKKENEWILLDDNHPGIISKDKWEQCNKIMDKNAERNNALFRKNAKVHIFAGLLECGECHNSFYAKQDKPNLDGYLPSLYTCSGRYNHLGCSQKTISDSIVGTFIFNYLGNLLRASKNFNRNKGIKELEKRLLIGAPFTDIVGIDHIGLVELYEVLIYSGKNILTAKINKVSEENISLELGKLQKEKSKFERALERLEDLYLFDEHEMSEKDYILKKTKLQNELNQINQQLESSSYTSDKGSSFDFNFLNKAEFYLLSSKLLKEDKIDHKNLVVSLDRENIKEFINTVLEKVIVKDKRVISIIFKNGLINTFIYNSKPVDLTMLVNPTISN